MIFLSSQWLVFDDVFLLHSYDLSFTYMCDCVCDKDVDEIRNDTSRCEEFVQLCTALKVFVGDSINLPDSSAVFDMFGKVSDICYVLVSHDVW